MVEDDNAKKYYIQIHFLVWGLGYVPNPVDSFPWKLYGASIGVSCNYVGIQRSVYAMLSWWVLRFLSVFQW